MARPTKEGLEYFPLDTDIDQDEKIIVVVAKFNMRGFGIIIRLMMEVYKNGYFYHWTEKEQYIFSMKVAEPVEFVNEVVQECLKWGFFHSEIYEAYGVLTSKGFQKRYMLAVNRRKDVVIKPEYNLLEEENHPVSPNVKSKVEQKEAKKKPTRKGKVYAEDNPYYKFARYFHKRVSEVAKSEGLTHLIIKADLQKWADEFRKLIEIDEQDKQLVKDVIDWVTVDAFWKTNVLSAKKLREKFSDLAIKMSASQRSRQTVVNNTTPNSKDNDIRFQKWCEEGNDPDAFDWRSGASS